MRLFILLIIIISAFTNITVVHAQEPNTTLLKELNAFNERFNQIVVDRDMEGFLSLYSKETLWIAPATPPVVGHDEPRKTFQFIMSKNGELVHTVDKLHLSDDGTQAVMIGTAVVKVEEVDLNVTGTYLFVMKKINGEWKILTDMWHQHTPK